MVFKKRPSLMKKSLAFLLISSKLLSLFTASSGDNTVLPSPPVSHMVAIPFSFLSGRYSFILILTILEIFISLQFSSGAAPLKNTIPLSVNLSFLPFPKSIHLSSFGAHKVLLTSFSAIFFIYAPQFQQ